MHSTFQVPNHRGRCKKNDCNSGQMACLHSSSAPSFLATQWAWTNHLSLFPLVFPANPASVSGLFLRSPPFVFFPLVFSLKERERREAYKREDQEESHSFWAPVPAATAAETIHPNTGRQEWHCLGIQLLMQTPWVTLPPWIPGLSRYYVTP